MGIVCHLILECTIYKHTYHNHASTCDGEALCKDSVLRACTESVFGFPLLIDEVESQPEEAALAVWNPEIIVSHEWLKSIYVCA